MRKLIVLLAILAIALMATACGGGGEQPAPQAPAGGAAPAAGNAEAGKALFAQPIINGNAGCATCHSLEPGKVIVGPSMAGIGTRAATTVPGQAAEQYIRTSIVKTNEFLAKGCNAGDPNAECAANLMPQDWEQKLTPDQINDLVAYLLTLK
jgi:nitric oxide reductase subunit C